MDGQDYPKILSALEEIKVDMTKVATKVEERNDTALIWRSDVCKKFDRQNEKIDKLTEKIGMLPCKAHAERYKQEGVIRALLWGAISVTFTILIVHLGWK